MASTLFYEFEAKSEPKKLWELIKNFAFMAPKAFSNVYDSVEVVEGDGKSTGTVRIIKYKHGLPVTSIKERLDLVDDGNKTVSYSFLEGDIFQFFKNFKGTLSLSPKGDGSIIKYYAEFERVNGPILFEKSDEYMCEFVFDAMDKYMLDK